MPKPSSDLPHDIPMFSHYDDDSDAAMVAAGWIIMASFFVVCVAIGAFAAWIIGV